MDFGPRVRGLGWVSDLDTHVAQSTPDVGDLDEPRTRYRWRPTAAVCCASCPLSTLSRALRTQLRTLAHAGMTALLRQSEFGRPSCASYSLSGLLRTFGASVDHVGSDRDRNAEQGNRTDHCCLQCGWCIARAHVGESGANQQSQHSYEREVDGDLSGGTQLGPGPELLIRLFRLGGRIRGHPRHRSDVCALRSFSHHGPIRAEYECLLMRLPY